MPAWLPHMISSPLKILASRRRRLAPSAACSSSIGPASSANLADTPRRVLAAVELQSAGDVRRVRADIHSPRRDYPVIGLAPFGLEGSSPPSLDELRAILGSEVHAYFVRDRRLLRKLPTASATQLSYRSVSVWLWWPCNLRRRLAQGGADRAATLVDFARQIEASRPLVQSRLARLEQRHASLTQAYDHVQQQLTDALAEGLETASGAALVERRLTDTWDVIDALADGFGVRRDDLAALPRLGLEGRMHVAILYAWMRECSDLRHPPPLVYIFGSGFIQTCAHQPEAVRQKLAAACSRIASSRADAELAISSLPAIPDPASLQLARPDGAKGWVAHVRDDFGSSAGACIRYWTHDSGLVEFDSITRYGASGA